MWLVLIFCVSGFFTDLLATSYFILKGKDDTLILKKVLGVSVIGNTLFAVGYILGFLLMWG